MEFVHGYFWERINCIEEQVHPYIILAILIITCYSNTFNIAFFYLGIYLNIIFPLTLKIPLFLIDIVKANDDLIKKIIGGYVYYYLRHYSNFISCKILALLFILLIDIGYSQPNWFIHPEGDDIKGDGSEGHPWQTIHNLSLIPEFNTFRLKE